MVVIADWILSRVSRTRMQTYYPFGCSGLCALFIGNTGHRNGLSTVVLLVPTIVSLVTSSIQGKDKTTSVAVRSSSWNPAFL